MTVRRTRWAALRWAVIWSFLAYLIPLVHRHGVVPVGFVLWAELSGDRLIDEPLWAMMDAALCAALQIAMGAFFYWVFRGRARLRAWGLVAVFPALAYAFNPVYQVYIPKRFLIEPDTRAETGEWPVACELNDVYLNAVRAGVALAFERVGQAWLSVSPKADPAILAMPGCAVTRLGRPVDGTGGGVHFALPGGTMLYQQWVKSTGKARLVFLDRARGLERPVASGDDALSAVLSADGSEVVWLHRVRRPDRRIVGYEVRRMSVATGEVTAVPLALPGRGGVDLFSEDADGRHLLIARNGRELMAADREGHLVGEPARIGDFHIGGGNLRVVDGGWVAWDGYRDRGRYRLAWRLDGARGLHEGPKGRGITGVSVSPSGRLIAVSVTSNLNIGDTKDSVYVLRTSDGVEVFRRFMPKYTRSPVAFLGDRFFAYSFLAGREGRVRVTRVPPDAVDR